MDASLKERLVALLQEVDVALQKEFIENNDLKEEEVPRLGSFAGGEPGAAMFYAYYYLFTGKQEHLDKCFTLIEKAYDYISENDVTYTICNGIAGVGWLMQHLISARVIDAESDLLDDIDEQLCATAVAQLRMGNYDYFHGAVGVGVYFLERPNNKTYLERIVVALDELSLSDDYGRFWDDSFSTQHDDDPPRVNFGMAHGMPSIIFFLSKCLEQGVKPDLTRQMVEESVAYMMHHSELENYVGSYFPAFHYYAPEDQWKNADKPMTRLAWCYGDVGTSCSLLSAAEILENTDLKNKALTFLNDSASRQKDEQSLFLDGGICHGHAGIIHIFHGLYKAHGDERYLEAALHWLDVLLDYIDKCGGMTHYKEYNGLQKDYTPSAGFLMGTAGIGLVFLGLIDSAHEPKWERYLLLK